MVRELAAAWHRDQGEPFAQTYASAWVLAGLVAGISVVCFAGLIALIPVLDIPPELRAPAAWFVVAQSTHAVLIVVLAPAFNMYVVQERFLAYNVWYVGLRTANLISTIVLGYMIGIADVPTGLVLHGILWAAIANAVLIASVAMIMARDRRLVPRLRLATRSDLRGIMSTFGWNSVVQVSMALHERVPPIIINLAGFGLVGNAIWGFAYRFVAYVRMATSGVQFGVDAVSARISSATDKEEAARAVRDFVSVQTRLNACVALPVGLAMFVLARPLLELWVGTRVEDPERILRAATIMTQILAAGLTSRAVSEGWILILYGAGHVRRYAPLVLVGGILNPILAIVLLLAVPAPVRIYAPALSFTIIITIVNVLVLPVVGARCLEVRYTQMLGPLTRPVIATCLAAPVLLLAGAGGPDWSLLRLAGASVGFGALYAPLAATIVLTPAERRRVFNGVMRRVAPSRRPRPQADA